MKLLMFLPYISINKRILIQFEISNSCMFHQFSSDKNVTKRFKCDDFTICFSFIDYLFLIKNQSEYVNALAILDITRSLHTITSVCFKLHNIITLLTIIYVGLTKLCFHVNFE